MPSNKKSKANNTSENKKYNDAKIDGLPWGCQPESIKWEQKPEPKTRTEQRQAIALIKKQLPRKVTLKAFMSDIARNTTHVMRDNAIQWFKNKGIKVPV